jgi:hypothetical protein
MTTIEKIINVAKTFSKASFLSGGVGITILVLGANTLVVPGFFFGLSCLFAAFCGWASWNSHRISQNIIDMTQDPQIMASEDETRVKMYMLRGTHGVAWLS